MPGGVIFSFFFFFRTPFLWVAKICALSNSKQYQNTTSLSIMPNLGRIALGGEFGSPVCPATALAEGGIPTFLVEREHAVRSHLGRFFSRHGGEGGPRCCPTSHARALIRLDVPVHSIPLHRPPSFLLLLLLLVLSCTPCEGKRDAKETGHTGRAAVASVQPTAGFERRLGS